MWVKRLSIFLVALLVVSCCVWALPGAKKVAKETPIAVEEDSQETQSENSQSSSQTEQTETSKTSDELLKTLKDNNFIIGADKINAIITKIENLESDVAINQTLLANQINQNEELEKKLKATRFFTDFGIAFGFKDKGINYGVVGDMGIKFGKGFLTKVGVQYMLGDFSNIKNLQWSLENMTVQATVGWEW